MKGHSSPIIRSSLMQAKQYETERVAKTLPIA
jgi:hypothetical protein